MANTYWNDWYSGWGWFLWIGVMLLLFSSARDWGYTYRVHRGYGRIPRKDALDILSEHYARGEIDHAEREHMRSAISADPVTR